MERNKEIREMLIDINRTRRKSDMEIQFIIPSRFGQFLWEVFLTEKINTGAKVIQWSYVSVSYTEVVA